MGEPTDISLRDTVRARLEVGSLPRLTDSRVLAGDSNGQHRCAACMDVIREEPEYNLVQDTKLHAHIRCFRVWLQESGALDERLEPSP